MHGQENIGLTKPSLLSFRSRGSGRSIPSRISSASSDPPSQQSTSKLQLNKSGSSCERPLVPPPRSINYRLANPTKPSNSSRLRLTSLVKASTTCAPTLLHDESSRPRSSHFNRTNKPRQAFSQPGTPLQSGGEYSFLSGR